MIHTHCPLGGSDADDEERYPANFDPASIDAAHFSARRLPDRIHYRMVRNRATGSLRADPILSDADLERLYRQSTVTYGDLEDYSTATYIELLREITPFAPDHRGLLEIGCGTGAFLAKVEGFDRVVGVEPSRDAAALAKVEVVNSVLKPGLFPDGSFSLICGFQVLDHLADPNAALQICRNLLVDGGVMLWVCHDAGAPVNRLLGRYSPVVDIEHPVLYDQSTIKRLFERNDFDVLRVWRVANRYPLWYWAQLAPLPNFMKRLIVRTLRAWGGTARLSLGNMAIVARK